MKINKIYVKEKLQNMENEDLVLYILMRNDLKSMTAGRAMAQASHASNAFIQAFGKNKIVNKWQKQTNQGFGTAIVLSVDFLKLTSLMEDCRRHNFLCNEVIDPEYSFRVDEEIYPMIDMNRFTRNSIPKFDNGDMLCFRKEVTCAYAFGDRNDSSFSFLFQTLPLHP